MGNAVLGALGAVRNFGGARPLKDNIKQRSWTGSESLSSFYIAHERFCILVVLIRTSVIL